MNESRRIERARAGLPDAGSLEALMAEYYAYDGLAVEPAAPASRSNNFSPTELSDAPG